MTGDVGQQRSFHSITASKAVASLEGGFEAWLAAGCDIHTISDSMVG